MSPAFQRCDRCNATLEIFKDGIRILTPPSVLENKAPEKISAAN
jgi:hypothetical protein